MLGDEAVRILNRHVPTGKARHARAKTHVQSVQGRDVENGIGKRFALRHRAPGFETLKRIQLTPDLQFAPPLSRDLRDFPAIAA